MHIIVDRTEEVRFTEKTDKAERREVVYAGELTIPAYDDDIVLVHIGLRAEMMYADKTVLGLSVFLANQCFHKYMDFSVPMKIIKSELLTFPIFIPKQLKGRKIPYKLDCLFDFVSFPEKEREVENPEKPGEKMIDPASYNLVFNRFSIFV